MKSSAGARLLMALLALAALRMLLIGATDPIPDEAYYYSWSDKIEACYWDQPAGIAVWNRIVRGIAGEGVFAMRLGAVILSLLSSFFLFDLGRVCLRNEKISAYGTLMAQVVPLFSVGAVTMLHDSLLGLFAVMTMAFFARAILLNKPNWWYAGGVSFALALYAKFSAVLLIAGLLVLLIASAEARKSLRRPEPYIAAALGAILFLPVISWNVRNGWVAYYAVTKLSSNVALSFPERILSAGDYIVSQPLLVTPILFAFMAWACVKVLREGGRVKDDGRLFLASMTAGIFLYFLLQSLRAKVQGNWAAVAYAPAALLAADLIAVKWSDRKVRRLAIAGIALSVFVTLVIHAQTLRPFLPIPPKADPTLQAHGWKELAEGVKRDLQSAGPNAAVMARNYQTASELKFFLGPDVDVYNASYASRGSQFDLTQDYRKLIGRDVVYVDTKGRSAKLFLHFAEVTELQPHRLGTPGRESLKLEVFLLKNFRIDGPLTAYFSSPFQDALDRLKYRIKIGRE